MSTQQILLPSGQHKKEFYRLIWKAEQMDYAAGFIEKQEEDVWLLICLIFISQNTYSQAILHMHNKYNMSRYLMICSTEAFRAKENEAEATGALLKWLAKKQR